MSQEQYDRIDGANEGTSVSGVLHTATKGVWYVIDCIWKD